MLQSLQTDQGNPPLISAAITSLVVAQLIASCRRHATVIP
jgi:hypothetical protein